MKKIWLSIRLFFLSLSWGMKGADKMIMNSNKELDNSDLTGIEQQKEVDSVYADLLKGVVTQEVKELRHEMYYAERKSYEYDYGGNGRASKRNTLFDYEGKVDKSDGYKIEIVQENKEDPSSLMDYGIFCNGEQVELTKEALQDLRTKDKRNFTIEIDRDFIPSFRIEQYAKRLIVKRIDEKHAILDIYISKYQKQFDKNSKLFLSAVDKIYMGDKRSDIVDFNNLGFISYCAYGTDDLKQYEYENLKFEDIIDFDDSYIFRFSADIKIDGYDIISEFYDEIAAQKSENKEMRKGATLNFENIVEAQIEEEYDAETAKKLLNDLNNE